MSRKPRLYGTALSIREQDIAGTGQQATNLDAVLRALPDSPAAPAAVDDFMQILRATGTRKPQGSATSFNDQ